jgi:hypothetical protein
MLLFGVFFPFAFSNKLRFSKPQICTNCASVVQNADGKYIVQKGILDDKALAFGTFDDTLNSTGWGVLDLVGQDIEGTTVDQAFWAVGLLEGFLTGERISQNAKTMNKFWNFSAEKNETISKFFDDQLIWAREQVADPENKKDPYWTNVGYVINQVTNFIHV